jgi:hypothetical protein
MATATLACGDDGGGSAADETSGGSGFTGGAETSESTGGASSSGDGVETFGEGSLRAILTFTYYPDDPVTDADFVGIAGAWRDAEIGVDDIDDFFALYGLQTTFPIPPAGADELEHNEVPPPFDWGQPEDWLLAGNGMKLVGPEGSVEALACLLMVGDEFPIYVATDSMLQPEGCAPDVAQWLPDTAYDIVLYGGDLFETNVLHEQVHTPSALVVTAPDIGQFNLAVPQDQDLEVAWSDDGLEGNRVIIRMFDMFGRMFTIHAVDDGAYTISADALGELATGPVTLTVARENVDLFAFTDGGVKVVSRYEHWGYLELY